MQPTGNSPISHRRTPETSETPSSPLESKASAVRAGLQADAFTDIGLLKRLVTVGDPAAQDVSSMAALATAERNAWPLAREADVKAGAGQASGEALPPRASHENPIDTGHAAAADPRLRLAQSILKLANEGAVSGWQAVDLALMIGKLMRDQPHAFRSLMLSQLDVEPSSPDSWHPLTKNPIHLGLGLAADPLAVLTHGGLDGDILDRCMALWSRAEGMGDDWQGALVQHLAQGHDGESRGVRAERLMKLFDARLDDMSPELCMDISHALLKLIEADEEARAEGKSAVAGGRISLAPELPSATQVTGLLNRFLQAHGFDPFREDRPFGASSEELVAVLGRDDNKHSSHAMQVWDRNSMRDTNKIGSPISVLTREQQLAMTARKVKSLWTHVQAQIAKLRSEPHPPRLGLRNTMIEHYQALADRLSREFPSLRSL